MQRFCLLLTTLLITSACLSQGFINKNRKAALKYLNSYQSDNNVKARVIETQNTITLLVRDSTVQNLDLVLYFDGKKVYKEVRTLSCDSCMQKLVTQTLANKKYDWKQVDQDFVSAKGYKLILNNENHSYSIERALKKED